MKLINYHPMTMIYFNWPPSVGLVGNWNQWSNQETALLEMTKHEEKRTLINFQWLEQPETIVSDNGVEVLATKAKVEQGINYFLPKILNNDLKFDPFSSLENMFHTLKIYILADHPFVTNLQNLLGHKNVIVVNPVKKNNFLQSLKTDLLDGDLEAYHQKIGANYQIKGPVVKAKQLGRTIGFPTANLNFKNSLPIKEGVYLVKVYLPNDPNPHWGMADYWNPSGFGWTFETNIFDFNQDIYGWVITVELIHFHRKNVPLKTETAIKDQLTKDYQTLKKLIK